MKKQSILFVSLILLAFTTLVWSCKKTNEDLTATNDVIAAAQDDSENASTSDDVFNEVDNYAKAIEASNFSQMKSIEGVCAPTITITHANESTTFPKVITLDFGAGCTGRNGNVKKGKVIFTISAKWAKDATRTISFENFYINERKIEGSKTVTNKGLNTNGNPSVTVVVDLKITKNDSTRTYIATRTREMTAGVSTPLNIWDDKYSITGSGSGVNRKGVAYTTEITKALIVATDCKWIQSGSVKVSVPSKNKSMTVDYGDGTCSPDKTITIVIDGQTKVIKLGI